VATNKQAQTRRKKTINMGLKQIEKKNITLITGYKEKKANNNEQGKDSE
jgi:hypothetical protein